MEKFKNVVRPEGIILEKFKDLDNSLGLVYYKGGDHFSTTNCFNNTIFVFSRCHSSYEVIIESTNESYEIDAYSILVLPPGCKHQIKGKSNVSHVTIFVLSPEIINKTQKLYNLSRHVFDDLRSCICCIPRTNWINEIMHRYVYERSVTKKSGNIACNFLETEIVKELYYTYSDKKTLSQKNVFNLNELNLDKKSITIQKALNYIERNLFHDLTIDSISKSTGASESTVLRAFKNDLATTPFAYIKARRLNEAKILLKQKIYSIAEIGEIIGYANTSAFTNAFKKKFKMTPSEV